MELEDMKTMWKSVKADIGPLDMAPTDTKPRRDARTRLIRRFAADAAVSMVCIILLATSHAWAPVRLPGWWLAAFCATISIGAAGAVGMIRSVGRIDVCENSNSEVMAAVARIKKYYKNLELVFSAVAFLLLLWITLQPDVVGIPQKIIVWCAIPVAFAIELVFYRKNVRMLNELKK